MREKKNKYREKTAASNPWSHIYQNVYISVKNGSPYQEIRGYQIEDGKKRISKDPNTEMTVMLRVICRDFKAAVLRMLQ